MLFEHDGRRPDIHATATIAATAVVSGDVRIGRETRVLHGAVITAESGSVIVGERCIIMEQAVLRGVKRHPLTVGSNVLVGPHAHLTGCDIADNVFLATGSTVFNGARIGAGSTVRINGIVHLMTELPPDSTVPIGWVAVGQPASIMPTSEHDEIWAAQEPLKFPQRVFGVERSKPGMSKMPELCSRYAKLLAGHDHDVLLPDRKEDETV